MAAFLSNYVSPSLAYAIAALVHVGLLLTLAVTAAAVFIWLERKVAGRIQDRLGPTRVGGRFGWLQSVADGIKLLGKEDLIPRGADRLLFRAAPYISFCASLSVYLALPFADGWVAQHLNTAVFFILAVAGLEVLGVILGGYASGSKWSLFGAMREAAQVVSYEVPMALCAVIPVMVAGTMDLVEIGNRQAGWLTNWLIFHDPFVFVAFFVYLTCAVASVNRAPFDLPEAESELVAGFLTEYSGFRWCVFFMAEYASMLAVSALAAILFLGGWNGPVPIAGWLGLTGEVHPLAGYLGNLLGMCNMLLKGVLGVICMMWLRWTLPRLRIDQVMAVCWKYCMPLAAAMFLGAMWWSYAQPAERLLGGQGAAAAAGFRPVAAADMKGP
ncbi:MAG: NADH-quinone oxidoreductase subunit NuoH [Thermoguttaceae bacterium]